MYIVNCTFQLVITQRQSLEVWSTDLDTDIISNTFFTTNTSLSQLTIRLGNIKNCNYYQKVTHNIATIHWYFMITKIGSLFKRWHFWILVLKAYSSRLIVIVFFNCIYYVRNEKTDTLPTRWVVSFATRSLCASGEMAIVSCKNCHNFISYRKSLSFIFFLWPAERALQLLSMGSNLYLYVCVTYALNCIVYIVKEVESFWGGLVNKWVWCVIERALEQQGRKHVAFVAYVEIGTNSCWNIFLKFYNNL